MSSTKTPTPTPSELWTPWGQFGWGRENMTAQERTSGERAVIDSLAEAKPESILTFADYRERYIAPRANVFKMDEIEQLIRKQFRFDEGWALWVAEQLLYGSDTGDVDQNGVGSCVGSSHVPCLAMKVADEVLREGDPEDVLGRFSTDHPAPYVPYSYQAGRCYVLGWWGDYSDGSWCGAQIEASQDYGFLPSDTEGLPRPVPQPSTQVVRSWNTREILDKWKPIAIQYDLTNSTQIKSADAAWETITVARTPIQICSNWAFKPRTYDSSREMWIYMHSGQWAHSMRISAAVVMKGARFFYVQNTWGRNAHKTPAGLGAPDGGFWLDDDTTDAYLRAAEALTVGELKGRPAVVHYSMF